MDFFGECPLCGGNLIPDPMSENVIYIRCENDTSCDYRRELSRSELDECEQEMDTLGLNDTED